MQLRQANPADQAMIAKVGADAWGAYVFAHEHEKPGQRQHVELAFLHFAQEFTSFILVIEHDGSILGWGARDTNADYISDLWIDPSHHRQGLGLRLMDSLMAQTLLLGHDEVWISSHTRNLPAITLYQKCGFVIADQYDEWSDSLNRVVAKVKMRAKL